MPGFLSPAAAFSGTLEDYMRHRETQGQVQLQNQMAERRMQLEEKRAEADLENQLAMRRESRERLDDMERNRVEKILGTMEPGDILPPDILQKAKTLGIPVRLQKSPEPQPIQPAAPEGIAAPESQGQEAPVEGTGVEQAKPLPTPAIRVAGSFQQRKAQEQSDQVKQLQTIIAESNGDFNNPQVRNAVLSYEMLTGKPIPAGLLRGQASDQEPVARQNPKTGAVERLQNGQWVPVTGDVPKGTHFMTVADHSAAEGAAAQRELAHWDQVHQQAVTELNDRAKPINMQLQGIEDLGTALSQKTPEADRLIAPLVLKATVSGTGSGFRMTRPEIEAVVGGRSKWETLSATLNQWSTDPKQALIITDEQRSELRELAKSIRDKAKLKSRKIIDIRHRIDDAKDTKEINHLRTSLMDELDKDQEPDNGGVDMVYDPSTRTFTKPGGR